MKAATFTDLAAAEAILEETRRLIGIPMEFTTGSRKPSLFGAFKNRVKAFATSKAAPAYPCHLCGAPKVAADAPCNVCGGTAKALGRRQQPAQAEPSLMSRTAFDQLTTAQRAHYCKMGGRLR